MGRPRGVGTPATTALERAGVGFSVHHYDHDPAAASFGLEAAEALGLSPDEVFKTLLVQAGEQIVVAVTPVSRELDLKAVARESGARRAVMVDPASAERLTGYVVGGISPIGQRTRLPTLVDATAARLTRVYVSAGRRGVDLALAPADLVSVTRGRYAAIAARPPSRS